MAVEIRMLQRGENEVLKNVVDAVFDIPVDDLWTTDFLNNPIFQIVVAIDDGFVVGMSSAVHDVHPDK